jgi:hypothetical protein
MTPSYPRPWRGAVAWRLNHAAIQELARELGLRGDLTVRRRRLRTCFGIHWAHVMPGYTYHDITLDTPPRRLDDVAATLGHELGHALDSERVQREAGGDAGAWASYCRRFDILMPGDDQYDDKPQEQYANRLGELLTYRILRDCITPTGR